MSAIQDLAAAVAALGSSSTAVTEPAGGLERQLSAAQAALSGIPEADSAAGAIDAAQTTWKRVHGSSMEAAQTAFGYAKTLV